MPQADNALVNESNRAMPERNARRARNRSRNGTLGRRQARVAYWFVLPQVIGLLAFTAVPLVVSLGYSFTRWDLIAPSPEFIGLENWRYLLQDDRVPTVLLNTAKFVLIGTSSFLLFSLVAALMTYVPRRGVGLYRAAIFLPYVLSQIAIGVIWRWMFNSQSGPITLGVELFGINSPDWLLDPATAMASIALVTTWQALGFGMTLFIASLQGVPATLTEAATVDGANWLQRFRHVTVPMISPTVFFLVVTSLIGALQLFDPVVAMTSSTSGPSTAGGPENSTRTLVLYLYNQMFNYNESLSGLGYAAALAWMLALLTFFITAVQFAVSRRWVHYTDAPAGRTGRGRRRP
ncbi:carbohydrate ABC transporter permease [Jiangella sp. DSM 45060]|uniref:carbohydrate ABC transporter permease n=1 Tax=Jiangella sp. DSM 45060 TaxID=1798224 RepID=UPI00087B85B9|nr:sugar ABC transporter permease [Jiangella sp. DSM 45060]SDT30956.1 multiple sugar transport system permease protein [Jiangella sp. DSM 45060]